MRFSGLLIGLLAFTLSVHAATRISGGDERLRYTGRVDFSTAATPKISWPGSSIAGTFTGPYLAVSLTDQWGHNFFNAFVDGETRPVLVIQAVQGEKTYVIADQLSPGTHHFLLTKRTEGEDGATVVNAFEVANGERFLAPPPRPLRRIEFFGDSITSGMGNEAPDDGPDNLAKDKNNFMAYDAITARHLDAELHVTSQSGIGVMVSWFPFVMSQFYDQLSAVGDNDSIWDFSSWIPDVVVINLLQNDSWLIDREHRLSPVPTDEQRVQAYLDFVKTIRGKYPHAYIVCVLGSMDAMQAGSKWPGYVSAAVERMQREAGDDNIDAFFFEFTGYAAHPRVKQHEANAARLTAFIKQKMKW